MDFEGVGINSSQDSEGFMDLQVPSNNLQDVVTSEMEDLVDYEDFEKDNQRWSDGSRKGNPLAKEWYIIDIIMVEMD